mmetsp:Transcript_1308/g.4123  ORF Transcript_1308/g.4123 Transcript_1308/m.4123 type:complete len:209 (-) Transcript_1308:14-640(-)
MSLASPCRSARASARGVVVPTVVPPTTATRPTWDSAAVPLAVLRGRRWRPRGGGGGRRRGAPTGAVVPVRPLVQHAVRSLADDAPVLARVLARAPRVAVVLVDPVMEALLPINGVPVAGLVGLRVRAAGLAVTPDVVAVVLSAGDVELVVGEAPRVTCLGVLCCALVVYVSVVVPRVEAAHVEVGDALTANCGARWRERRRWRRARVL